MMFYEFYTVAAKEVLLILLGASGFFLSFFIHHKKKQKEPLICPMRSDCNTVVKSRYSKLLGIPLEVLGMLYYGSTVLGYSALLIWPGLIKIDYCQEILSTLALLAFLVSVYLTLVQLVALRQWCVWCLT